MSERRVLEVVADRPTIETRDDGSQMAAGYAAVYYRADDPGTQFELWAGVMERIMPGAFDQSVGEDDIRALFNHDPNQILGRTIAGTLRLSTNRRGLRYEIDLPDTQAGRDLATSLKRGDVSASSFAFDVRREAWIKDGNSEIRELHDLRLVDVSPVTYPAYTSTTAGLRAEGLAEARNSFDRLRAERDASKGRDRDVALTRARLLELDSEI